MSITRMIIVAIIANIVVLQCTQEIVADLSIDEYLGTWYDVAILFPIRLGPNPIKCQWSDARPRDDDDQSFYDVFTSISRRRGCETYLGVGTIVGSEIHIQYSKSKESTLKYEVTSYNNGNDLILRAVQDLSQSLLISRYPSASEEAVEDFKTLASDIGEFVHFIDNMNCEDHE